VSIFFLRNCSFSNDCSFPTPTQAILGTYEVDAKVLLWNSKGRNYEGEQACKKESKRGDVPRDFLETMYPTHSGFKGFKLYWPTESCCEVSVHRAVAFKRLS
jgi:hypothetical protein